MTFHAYALPEGAPQKQVWFAVCDVCHKTTAGPFGNTPNQQQNMKPNIEGRGWRYRREHPMDTCPACLGAEHEMRMTNEWEYVGEDERYRRFTDNPAVVEKWIERGFAVRRRTKQIPAGPWEPFPGEKEET